MGCHTWFSRPITDEEFKKMKEYAPKEIYYLTGDSQENIKSGLYDKNLYNLLMKSYNEDIPCVYGEYWWQLGYGEGNPDLEISFTREIRDYNQLFVNVPEYNDLFRIKNYPKKIITSRKNLRQWMGKRYFKLTNEQLERVSEFFREYPGGVITFG